MWLFLLSGLEARGDLGGVVAGVVEIDKSGGVDGADETEVFDEVEPVGGDPDDARIFAAMFNADPFIAIVGTGGADTGITVNSPNLALSISFAISLALALAFAFSSLYTPFIPYPDTIIHISR